MRKEIALAVALALGSTLAIAAGDKATSETTGSPSATTGGASDKSSLDKVREPGAGAGQANTPEAFWDKHAKQGTLSKDDAMKFRSADGKPIDFQKLDANNDNKISQSEWNAYHSTTGAAGRTGGPPSAQDKRDLDKMKEPGAGAGQSGTGTGSGSGTRY
jgi:hypothetical protein